MKFSIITRHIHVVHIKTIITNDDVHYALRTILMSVAVILLYSALFGDNSCHKRCHCHCRALSLSLPLPLPPPQHCTALSLSLPLLLPLPLHSTVTVIATATATATAEHCHCTATATALHSTVTAGIILIPLCPGLCLTLHAVQGNPVYVL